jgi:macrolide-specific efflux system membrane fusion protein
MMCLSNTPTRFFLLFGWGLTIGTTNAIAQSPASQKPVMVEDCNVSLIDRVSLSFDKPGVLEFVMPDKGDSVAEGEVIIALQSEVPKAQKAIAEKEASNDVEIRYARKAYELAEAEHRKALEANRRLPGTVAPIEVDRLQLAAERARLQIEQAEHTIAVAGLKAVEAGANVKTNEIVAPFDGIVVEKYKSRGEGVRQGDPILEIQSTARLEVSGYIGVSDMFRVKRGDKVKVKLNIPELNLPADQQEVEGVLKLVNPTVDLVNQKVHVVAEVQNPKDIMKAGLPTTMTIFPGTADETTTTLLERRR